MMNDVVEDSGKVSADRKGDPNPEDREDEGEAADAAVNARLEGKEDSIPPFVEGKNVGEDEGEAADTAVNARLEGKEDSIPPFVESKNVGEEEGEAADAVIDTRSEGNAESAKAAEDEVDREDWTGQSGAGWALL